MNKLDNPKLIQIYDEIFDSIYPVVSDHEGDNRRFKSKKFAAKDIDFTMYDAYAGALKDRYIVIDVDNKNGDDEGSTAWDVLLVQLKLYESLNCKRPETFTHKTKTGGFHLFFKLPTGTDKKTLPTKLCQYVEIKITESYIAGSYIESKGVGGRYSLHADKEVMVLPSELLGLMLKNQVAKKDKAQKNSVLLEEANATGEFIMGKNDVDWENISYEEIKARMNTLSPDIDYAKWLYQMYLFVTIYKHLQSLERALDNTCEDFLIEWSAKGSNKGKDDSVIIRGLVASFDMSKNEDKLLPENNCLISDYNSATSFESYAKFLAEKIHMLRTKKASIRVIGEFIEENSDGLANKLIEDIKIHCECFMLNKENKTDVITLLGFTTKNRWEKIISNATTRKARDPIIIETLFSILSRDGQTLYSKHLRVYCELLFPELKMLGKFADRLLLKIKTSLYNIDLSPRRMPLDCDILAFKNIAVKFQKQEPCIIAISWEEVRSYRLTEEIYVSTQSSAVRDFDHFINNGIIFDTKQLRSDREKITEDMYLLFAPMFWDFSVPYKGESYEEFKEKLNQSAADRVHTFFTCMGKSMLRYKRNIAMLFFILAGDRKAQDENGANGKSFVGQFLLPSLFGRSRIATRSMSNSKENKDKFTESSLEGIYLQVLDDLDDSEGGNVVNVKHLIKKVGYRPAADIRPMHGIAYEVEMFYDIVIMANNIDPKMSSDAGNKRRIQEMILYNTNKRCNYGNFSDIYHMLAEHRALSESFLDEAIPEENITPEYLEEKRLAFINKALYEAYLQFFTSPFVKNIEDSYTLTDNIYFTYLAVLAELFGTSLPEVNTQQQISLKTKALIYLIESGNVLLKAGTFNYLKGLVDFEIEDKGTPLLNIFKETIKCHKDLDLVGLLVEKRNLLSFLSSSLLLDTVEHKNEISSFVSKLPELDVCEAKDGRLVKAVNLHYIDIGSIMTKITKEGTESIKVRFNTKLLTRLQAELSQEEDRSPFKSFDKDLEPLLDATSKLLNSIKLKVRDELLAEYFEKNPYPQDNNWLRLRR